MAAWQGLLEELVRDSRPAPVASAASSCVCRATAGAFVDRGRSTVSGLSASPRLVAGAAEVDDGNGLRLLSAALGTAAAPHASDSPTAVVHVNGGSWGR